MPSEIWKPIFGFEGFYEVSDQGRVRRLSVVISLKTRWGGMAFSWRPGLILKPAAQHGYLRVTLCQQGKKAVCRSVHKLVLEAFVGPCPPDMESRHLDGTRSNCWLSNLCWGTKIDNMQDRERHGKTRHGEAVNTAKLTAASVLNLRAIHASGKLLVIDAAKKYGVRPAAIYDAVNRKTWTHI